MKREQHTLARKFPFRMTIGIVLVTAFTIAIIWGWKVLHNPHFMPIRNVKLVATYQHIPPATFKNIIIPYVTNTGLFSIHVEQLKEALLEQPWVYTVLIKRIWPSEIEIIVTEQKPVAVWNKQALLNMEGEVFTPLKKTFPDGLPLLQGPNGQQQVVLEQWQQFNQAISPLNLALSELDLNSRGSWQMILSNQMKIILGRVDIAQRFNRFLTIYQKIPADRSKNISNIDLRYSNGMAVSFNSHVSN